MQREDVEALMSYLRGEKEDEAADLVAALLDRAERAEAERDAAFAAGQEDMRERAAEAVSYLGRMKGLRGHGVDAPEVAHFIRALPINPRP